MRQRLKRRGVDAEVETRAGSLGQYDVVVDGEIVATRTRGLKAFLSGGWPTADEVVEAVESRPGFGA